MDLLYVGLIIGFVAVSCALMSVGAVLVSMSGAALGVQIARFPRSGLSPVLR